jgi:hypothetical protein
MSYVPPPPSDDPNVVYRTGLSTGQVLLGLFLLCFGILPGIVYFIAASRQTRACEPASLDHNPLASQSREKATKWTWKAYLIIAVLVVGILVALAQQAPQ